MANPLKSFLKTEFKKPTKVEINEEIEVQEPVEPTFDHLPPEPEVQPSYESEMKRLFAIKNPKTQLRYDIPLLDRNAPDYFFKYCEFMKLKERDEVTFNKILGWE